VRPLCASTSGRYFSLSFIQCAARFLYIEIAPQPVSKELKKRWSHFIRKVYETDPLTCPKCQGEMRIISFIDQPDVIKKILQHVGLWEESHAPPGRSQKEKEITFDPSYSQLA